MKILIIGSKGFIGSNAVIFFTNKKYEVWKCGVSENSNELNYFKVEKEAPNYNTIFKNHKFDICINASGSPGVSFSTEEPLQDYKLNVINVYLVLNAIRLFNPKCKFLNLSSAAVYGNPKFSPIFENSNLSPLSPYGYHKLMSEQIVEQFQKMYNLRTCTVRIFSAYGPKLNKQLFWDIYQKSIASVDNKIKLFGDGSETRDFIFINDILEAFYLIIEKHDCTFNGEIYNLASGTETTIAKAASIFLNIINPKLSIEFNGLQKIGDPKYWRADISKLNKLNFTPTTNLENGLNKYYEWILLNKRK
jgi:UDP-glucose 4-epimerase